MPLNKIFCLIMNIFFFLIVESMTLNKMSKNNSKTISVFRMVKKIVEIAVRKKKKLQSNPIQHISESEGTACRWKRWENKQEAVNAYRNKTRYECGWGEEHVFDAKRMNFVQPLKERHRLTNQNSFRVNMYAANGAHTLPHNRLHAHAHTQTGAQNAACVQCLFSVTCLFLVDR